MLLCLPVTLTLQDCGFQFCQPKLWGFVFLLYEFCSSNLAVSHVIHPLCNDVYFPSLMINEEQSVLS